MDNYSSVQKTPKAEKLVQVSKGTSGLQFSLPLHMTDMSSPTECSRAAVYSPVTDLTMNMCELSTSSKMCYGDTPKRRLSLCSSEGSTPSLLQPVVLDMPSQEIDRHRSVVNFSELSPDENVDRCEQPSRMSGQKTSDEDRSPLELLESKSAAFRRFQAMPLPFCGFDQSPQAAPLPGRSTEASLGLHFSLDDEDDENSQDSGVGFEKLTFQASPPSNCLSASENTPERRSFIFDDEVDDKECSPQDVGVYFDKERVAPRCSTSRRGLFRSPSARPAPVSLRLLGHKSRSFDSRPRPAKRREPDVGPSDCEDEDGSTPCRAVKRQRSSSPRTSTPGGRRLQRCHSEVIVKSAMNRGDAQPDLIADFSRPYTLPLVASKHTDLKAIDAQTVAQLLRNEWSHVVERFLIIDCRYPYEFKGGHIQGAQNLYTKDAIMDVLLNNSQHWESDSQKSTVLIFHCEFSSERGPKLSRFLRNKDRDAHKECYPSLHFPEVYLLEGGYKAFFAECKELCVPQEYLPMLHADHNSDLRHFRAKSKSWAGERAARAPFRTGLRF